MARTLVFLVCLAVGTAMAQPGYIRLQGDQFIDENGAPFFPMVMNYFIDFFYPANAPPSLDPSAAELAPCGYGRSSFFGATGECAYPSIAAGPASIVQDLLEMKAMGFNTIRYLSRVKKKAGDGHLLSIKAFPSGQDELSLNLDPPYDPQTNLVFEFQMNTVLQVCSLANTVGMKVLFEIGGEEHALDLNADWPEIQDHLDYIEAIATFIEAQDVTNLLAYEFYGEPTFTDQRPAVLPQHTRAQICEIAHAWNQRLKQEDPGHLTTIGAVFMDDLWQEGWDPMLLEVDFVTMHLYLLHDGFEHDDDPSTFLDKATKRYADMLYEYDKLIRKPYIITETGFQGQDNPNGYPSYVYPYLLGSEQDQDDFLRATFPLVLGSRCAGYGWWVFQNVHWCADPPPWPQIPNDPCSQQDYSERYYGIHKSGDPGPMDLANGITGYEGLRKQAAETFVSWVTNPPAPSVQYGPVSPTVDMNDAYYNPYGHPSNSTVYTDVWGQAYYGTLTGRLVDQGGNPIVGATVKANSSIGRTNPGDFSSGVKEYNYSAYTDSDGRFEIRAFDPEPWNHLNSNTGDSDPQENIMWGLNFGAYATAWMKKGYVGEDNAFYPFLPGVTHALQSLVSQVDQVVEYAVVWSNETQNFEALASLSFENSVVGGSSDMKARYVVHWGQEFRALTGCEVHAHTAPVVFTCDNIANVSLRSTSGAADVATPANMSRKDVEIDLGMHRAANEPSLSIKPNPGQVFDVVLKDTNEVANITEIEAVNNQGLIVGHWSYPQSSFTLDLRGLAAGPYVLIIRRGEQRFSQAVIISN